MDWLLLVITIFLGGIVMAMVLLTSLDKPDADFSGRAIMGFILLFIMGYLTFHLLEYSTISHDLIAIAVVLGSVLTGFKLLGVIAFIALMMGDE